MRILNKTILKYLLTIKGRLTQGMAPSPRIFDCVEIAPFKNNCQAAVTISADFELAWAFRGRSQEQRTLNGIRTRENIPYLIALFDKHNIPITWATVGHLFLDSCKRDSNGRAHPEMPRPIQNMRFSGDWYRHDPCTDTLRDPIWYCPDLIKKILNSKVNHEIGTHSFSHIDFSDDCSTSELVDKEIASCIGIMAPLNLVPRSLVFPHNRMGYSHLATLFRNNIIAVRHRDQKISLSYPQRTAEGVYKLFESMNTRSSKSYDYVDKAKILISEAKKRRSAYHLWFHPSDPFDVFDNEFRRIIEHIAAEQNSGAVWVATMADLASYCEARESTKILLTRSENILTLSLSSSFDKNKYPCNELTLLLHNTWMPEKILYRIKSKEFSLPIMQTILANQKNATMITVPVDAQTITIQRYGQT